MCGIVGLFDPQSNQQRLSDDIEIMTRQLKSRGPDSSGTWVHPRYPLAFGHRRLAIVDLSPTGHQPMFSMDGSLTLVLNGEIYNFLELRRDLEKQGAKFRGTSDTEVFLESIRILGVEATLQRSVGMFAFAVWNERDRTLTLGRDRFGEKPLFYGMQAGRFYFGSELKGIRAHSRFEAKIDTDARNTYFAYGYIPSPLSIYREISKLEPGHYAQVRFDRETPEIKISAYWDANRVVERTRREPFRGTFQEAVTATERLLKESIALQQVADVPVGAFLSGGIDSSTIVSLFQEVSSKRVSTFTIGFKELDFDESQVARRIAQHLNTDHHEWIVTDRDALEVVSEMGWVFDEPFSDSSQIPTMLVSRFARSKVTVSISGDAGDELFGGYNRYFWDSRVRKWLDWLPSSTRSWMGDAFYQDHRRFGEMYSKISAILPNSLQVSQPVDKFKKLGSILRSNHVRDFYPDLLLTQNPTEILRTPFVSPPLNHSNSEILSNLSISEKMMFLDLVNYLPGDILTKVDRATMAVGLEARVPLLDHRIVEWAWSLPENFRIRDGSGKAILREILRRRIPDDIVNRPKMGFGVPIGDWLRNEFKAWARDLLDQIDLHDDCIQNDVVLELWEQHQGGVADHGYRLWNILMYLQWYASQERRV